MSKYFEDNFPDWLSGVNFKKSVGFTAGATFSAGTFNFTGATVTGLTSGVESIVATSANAFQVGATSANSAFNIDTSGGVTDVTGLNINSASAGSGLALSILSSGTNESATADAKGTGTFGINTLATNSGKVTIGNATSLAGLAVNGLINGTSASSTALAIGLNGTTNPAFQVDASTASQAAGLNVKGAVTGGTVAISAIDSGGATNLTLDGKGTGTITINGVGGTGAIQLGGATSGNNATGLTITPNVASSGLAVAVVSTASAENLTIDAKGTGTITLGTNSSGNISFKRNVLIPGTASGSTYIAALLTNAGGAANSNVSLDFQPGNLSTGRARIIGTAPGGSNASLSFHTSTNNGAPTEKIFLDNAGSLSVGANGQTNPVLSVISTAGSVATGLSITGAATGGTTVLAAIDSGSNTNLSVVPKGSGFVSINTMVNLHTPTAINSSATATAAQVQTGYITSTSAAATTITLPTGTALGTALGAVQGTTMDLFIDNTAGANTVTIAVAVNGILSAAAAANGASQGLLTVPNGVTGQACFRLMFSSATAYTFTRIA